jgi:hypothetical protein
VLAVFCSSVVLSGSSGPALGHDKVIETKNLRLVYDDALQFFIAEYAAKAAQNAFNYHSDLYGYDPDEKINVGLYDYSDFGNGGATNTPWNNIIFTIAPINFVYETSPSNSFFRTIFGGKVGTTAKYPETMVYAFLTSPRYYTPRWYHEGLAVFLETWMAGGTGRAQGPYDEMVFRSMVRDSSYFYDPVGLVSEASRSGFMMGVNNYLYGTRFISYLAHEYSPEKVIEWTSRADGSHKYYGTQFHKVFGTSLDDAWDDWVAWEHDFQKTNLDSIRVYPVTPVRDLSERALGSVSRAYHDPDTGELYFAVRYPGTVAHIAGMNLETGAIRKIHEVKGPALYFVTSLAFDPVNKTLFYSADNDDWRDLHSVNVLTGRHKIHMMNERVGDLSFCPADSSLWGVRHFNGLSAVVRIPPPYDEWNLVYSWPYGTDIYDIDISPDGEKLVGSIAEISGRQTLRLWETESLFQGDTTSTTLQDFGASLPANFSFSPDQKYIWGSSYYTGVSNIWRWNVEADSIEIVTNAEDGLFRPLPISEDSVVVFRYTGEGFVPAMLADAVPLQDVSGIDFLGALTVEKHPVLADWIAPPPSAAQLDTTFHGDYVAWKKISLASVYPIVQGYNVRQESGEDKSFVTLGLNFVLSDPLMNHKLNVAASYSPSTTVPDDERVHLALTYDRYDWSAMFKWNPATFYDIFGPTKRSRRGYIVGLGHSKNLVFDQPREMTLNFDLSGHFDIERLPDAQNVASSSDELYFGSVSLDYSNKRFSMGAVEYEKGHTWLVDVSATLIPPSGPDSSRTSTEFFPQFSFDFDIGFPLPIGNSSLWLRTTQGISVGERLEPSANFWFGGFGNNYVDRLSIKRYHKSHAFPGLELNEIGGTNYQRTMLEWNLPPLRFRRVGKPGLYATWARISLFGSGITTNIDSDLYRTKAANLGAQLDIRFTLLSNMRMTLSTGYAVAVQDDERRSDEFMFSVKIL